VAGLKKKHFQTQEKEKAVVLLRGCKRPLRLVAWTLGVSLSALDDWNQEFDLELRLYKKVDNRGKTAKVDISTVRMVVDKAREFKERGKSLRIRRFAQKIKEELNLNLGWKTIQDILIANDLYRPKTRQKRPMFYQSLCRGIPNGQLSLDGSELEIILGNQVFKYNLELCVDVDSFCHTGFELSSTETGDAVLNVLEQHVRQWGHPLAIICDHGSANLSDDVLDYLLKHDIEILPAGPGNPKGNGTDEGAFSQLKKTIGSIRIDTSSLPALGKSVLENIIAVYVSMRNQMSLRSPRKSPLENMQNQVCDQDKARQRQKHQEYKANKNRKAKNFPKLDHLDWIISQHGISLEPCALQRAKKCIQHYDMEAIIKSEKAFLKAVHRDSGHCTLPYFFGILKNIQQEMDDQRYQDYCRRKYSCELMLENERRKSRQQEQQASVEGTLKVLLTAMDMSLDSIRKSALNRCREYVKELLGYKRYARPLWKQFMDAIGARIDLDLVQKEEASKLIEEMINQTARA